MEIERTLKLLDIYGTCPKCGKEVIESGKDVLRITDSTFHRFCNCGFSVNIVENDSGIKG